MPMPTVAELAASSYTGQHISQSGMTSEDYRVQCAFHGETVRYFQSRLGADGERTLIEVTLAATVRVMRYNTVRDWVDEEYGLISKGSTSLSVLPDEIDPMRGDRFILTAAKRVMRHQTAAVRTGSTDTLPYQPVASIERVTDAGGNVLVVDVDYSADETGITWLTNAVAEEESYAVIWKAHPSYLWLAEEDKPGPIGTDDLQLPRRGVVKLEVRLIAGV